MKTRFLNWTGMLLVAPMVLSASCASQKTAQGTPSISRQKVENLVHFDVASCQKPSGLVSEITNEESIFGGILSVQPAILECFVPPQNRQGNQNTHVKLSTSVSSQTTLHTVQGENLSPSGVACIEAALAPLQFQQLPPEETERVASIVINYPANSPQVTFGISEVSDVVGHVRLAIGKACHCFASMKNVGIAEVSMALTVSTRQPAKISLTSNNPNNNAIIACLMPEISKLKLQASRGELVLERVPLQFINSTVKDFPAEARLELQFLHADGLRTQNASIHALRSGERVQASTIYNQLLSKHKARLSTAPKDLNISCETLMKADEAWVATIEEKFELDKRIADIAARLRSVDSRWEAAANAASNTVPESRNNLVEAQKTLAFNKNACAKKTPSILQPSKRRREK
ncbi:MAG: hypothetical protein FWC28_08955 [Proteobacteria bacterium]|nr:hypothetical protein [Cystobacterineae bacterium]MCL2258328.1 hypothetical protein [Cystobacterineae bacterium]MCL2315353.1 hypothetical protein [Pseudomonadota bacterium]